MDPHERATSVWYRIAGLLGRKELAPSTSSRGRSAAQQEAFLEAAKLVLTGDPIESPASYTSARSARQAEVNPSSGSQVSPRRIGRQSLLPSCSVEASSGHGVSMICSPARSK
jgi:hypothetical protein